jgi:hypothetical protein
MLYKINTRRLEMLSKVLIVHLDDCLGRYYPQVTGYLRERIREEEQKWDDDDRKGHWCIRVRIYIQGRIENHIKYEDSKRRV